MLLNVNKSDRPIIVVCLIGIAICIYFLSYPEHFSGTASSSESAAIGKISALSADVRYKTKSNYFWSTTSVSRQVSKGDSLFTGEASTSEVTLADGKILKISENSLVHFSSHKDQLLLDLAFGSVNGTGLEVPLVVNDCGQKYVIQPNQAQFQMSKTEKCGSFNVEIKSGSLKVNNQVISKTKPKLKTQKITIADTFAPQVTEVIPMSENTPEIVAAPEVAAEVAPVVTILQTPKFLEPLKKMTLRKNSQVEIAWNSVDSAKSYSIEMSSSVFFQNAVAETVETPAYVFKPNEDGTYYFRVKANGDPSTVTSSEFSVAATVAVTYPAIQVDTKRFETDYPARSPADVGAQKTFPIKWNEIPNAKKYILEVSNSKSFKNTSVTEVLEPNGALTVPRTGVYNFRVTAKNAEGRTISSMPSIGEIIYRKVFQMSKPVIEKSILKMSYYFQKEFGQFVWLRWKTESSSAKYRLEISRTADFKKINAAHVLDDSKFLIKSKLTKGDYFWRVRSETADQFSDWSETASLKIQTK